MERAGKVALLGLHNRATCAHFSAPAADLGLDVAATLDDGHVPTSWACAWRSAVGTRTRSTTNCCISSILTVQALLVLSACVPVHLQVSPVASYIAAGSAMHDCSASKVPKMFWP